MTLAKSWEGRHRIFWISDTLHYGQPYLSLPIHQKAIPGGLLNTWKVWRFIKANQIELVHTHSRRAHWVGAQAAALAGIPHVATIHQPPPVHFFSKMFPCLGDHTIAIDEAVEEHLRIHFRGRIRQLSLIRNGIDLQRFEPGGKPADDNRILLLGRLSGGRWNAFTFFVKLLQRAAAQLPKARYQIAGRVPEERQEELRRLIEETRRAIAPSTIELVGFIPDLVPVLRETRAVVAGGRSALESLACGKLVIALGEKGVIGLCGPETLPTVLRSNFGDHLIAQGDQFYPAKMEVALREVLNPQAPLEELARWGRGVVEEHYNAGKTDAAVENIYFDVIPPGRKEGIHGSPADNRGG